MVKLTEPDRRSLAEGIIATGNICFGGLFVAQLLPTSGYSLSLVGLILGIAALGFCYFIAIKIMRGGER